MGTSAAIVALGIVVVILPYGSGFSWGRLVIVAIAVAALLTWNWLRTRPRRTPSE